MTLLENVNNEYFIETNQQNHVHPTDNNNNNQFIKDYHCNLNDYSSLIDYHNDVLQLASYYEQILKRYGKIELEALAYRISAACHSCESPNKLNSINFNSPTKFHSKNDITYDCPYNTETIVASFHPPITYHLEVQLTSSKSIYFNQLPSQPINCLPNVNHHFNSSFMNRLSCKVFIMTLLENVNNEYFIETNQQNHVHPTDNNNNNQFIKDYHCNLNDYSSLIDYHNDVLQLASYYEQILKRYGKIELEALAYRISAACHSCESPNKLNSINFNSPTKFHSKNDITYDCPYNTETIVASFHPPITYHLEVQLTSSKSIYFNQLPSQPINCLPNVNHHFNSSFMNRLSCKVFVGGVPMRGNQVTTWTRDQLHKGLSIFGPLSLIWPKGSGRVAFNSPQGYLAAITTNFICIECQLFSKVIQIDPYLEDAICSKCYSAPGIYFCRHLKCFDYFCPKCWINYHGSSNTTHKPLRRTLSPNSLKFPKHF
ncbi:uncharacterized protein DC041_0000815 [Schistosoma bovis]|uniref:Cytoplasmic polyadenylation element-binding protein ZZ domain-containing protein n=1 Tax=Schistosoma bovis TaxID=6184 RepID=A0A430Q7Z8_SCHBO|nr:uncharacterized protein DC041_0000815 [Schistosoma bovis]